MNKRSLRQFVRKFDFNKPNWSGLPSDFPDCDLAGLTSEEIGKFTAIRNLWQLSRPEKPKARSRAWQSSSGYIYLIAWSNASLLRLLVRKYTQGLPKSEFRLKSQLDDAARSTVANIEEGFARPTTSQYLDFLGYSQASLKEVKGDVQRCQQDGFLKSVPGSSLASIGIDLKDWHEALKKSVISRPQTKGNYGDLKETKSRGQKSSKVLQDPLKSFKSKNRGSYRNLEEVKGKSFSFGYPPVDNLKAVNLTYEILIELINKTDWHLRRLVEALEKKLNLEKLKLK